MKKPTKKPRTFYLVLFKNVIGEKTGHVYYSKKEALSWDYPIREIVKVVEVQRKKK